MPVDYRMLDTQLPERLGSLAKSIKMNVIAGKSRPQQNTLASLAQPQIQQEGSGLEDLGNGIMVDRNGAVQVSPERQASFDAWADNYNKMQFVRQMLKDKAQQKPEKLQFNADAGGFIEPPSAQNPQGRVIPLPGFKPKGDAKAKGDAEKESMRRNNAVDRAGLVINTVDDALGKTGFFTTGLTGATLGNFPGTNAYDLRKTIDTVKANIGFSELQAMREASPTGGALGQVAVQELNMLQAVLGSIDPNQSEDETRKKLNQVRKHYDSWKRTMEEAGYTGSVQGDVLASSGDTPPAGAVRRIK